jgi:hypothetical protein
MQELGNALLCTQRALLRAVTPQLRAVVVDLDNDEIVFYIRFYYDREVSDEEIDLWQCAITEASAGLDPIYDLDNDIIRLDFPEKIPAKGRYAYLRKE